jgi:hypothetical protein
MENNSLENIFKILEKVNALLKENGAYIDIAGAGSVTITGGELYTQKKAVVTITFPD